MRRADLLLAALVVALLGAPVLLLDNATWEGSDQKAAKLTEGFRPVAAPLWRPPSAEIEAGLFAAQAAAGAGVLGYLLGRFGRRGGAR